MQIPWEAKKTNDEDLGYYKKLVQVDNYLVCW